MNQEDQKRLNELKIKIWGLVALNLLRNQKNPFEIRSNDIESHRGRISKAVRLLGKYVTDLGIVKVKTPYGSESQEQMYRVNYFEESKVFGTVPLFTEDIKNLHNELFKGNYYYHNITVFDDQFEVDTIGYRDFGAISSANLIYIHWNIEDYHIISNNADKHREEIKVYPKALLDTRMKALMRAIIEQYFHTNFQDYIEKDLNIKKGSLKTNDHFNLKIRNFTAHGYRFDMERYFGKNGFMEEYTHFRNYFQALMDNLNNLQQHIEKSGGHAAITERYRKDIISSLIRDSALYSFQPPKNLGHKATIKDTFKDPFFNTFIVRNIEYLDYDLLYKDDQSILIIDKDNECPNLMAVDIFEPDQEELDLINKK
jgi:hypothetical protein